MTSFTVTKSPKSESETRKVKVGYYSPLSKRVETTMTSKTILDPPDFALLFSSTAPKSLHTEAKRPPQYGLKLIHEPKIHVEMSS